MNVLFLHSDALSFKAKKKTKLAKELEEKLKEQKVGECLACFLAFEEADNGKEQGIAKKLAEEVGSVAGQLGVKTIVLYPYVHLLFGKKPSKPETALEILELAEKGLGKKYSIVRSPFGWYKEFSVKCKGHPMAELSRVIELKEGEESEALKKEETLKSYWHVLDTKGKLYPVRVEKGEIKGFDFKGQEGLERFALYEMAKSRAVTTEPPHVKLMKQLELADYEPGTDPGNLRYPPKGRLVKGLLERYVTEKMHEYGAMEIESPIMYDYEHPSLKKYLNRFPARQYTIQTPNKKVFLRFAACFGQFLMIHDGTVSYKNLPLKLYELTRYSFRVEKRGELTGLRRLRAFTMPDCHAFCSDMEQAKKELSKRFEVSKKLQKGIGLKVPQELELGVRVVKGFWEENKDFVKGLVKKWRKPALVEMWDKQFFYFILKYEWNFVDNLGKAAALTTDQIDVENAENYDLFYIDDKGKKKRPLILHLSPSGAIERVMYSLLEREWAREQKGKNGVLPLWLSPTQVRLLPVADKHINFCKKLAEKISEKKVRVDVDDRKLTISKKIVGAEKEWVPFILVVGDKEIKAKNKFNARIRSTGKQKTMTLKEITSVIEKDSKGKPFAGLPMPLLLSDRPTFIG